MRCNNCLIKEGTTLLKDFFAIAKDELSKDSKTITLNENGICQYCQIYKNNYDKEFLDYELAYFINNKGSDDDSYHSIVALSGGKDSLTALYLAKVVLKLNVIAMTYDNGFIPEEVIEQSRRICNELDIPYIVCQQEMYNEFKSEYKPDNEGVWEARTGIDFCSLCSKNIWKYLKELCLEYKIDKVILGNKIYSSLEPKVSSIKKFPIYDNQVLKKISCINLLFALKISKTEQKEILKKLSWVSPNLKGYTSNCLVPGFTEYARSNKIKTDSDAGYIEMELRSNMYSLEEAKELMKKEYSDSSKEIEYFFKAK